jgi:transaldolase
MKIFIDTANIEDIRKYSFILDGVTTNPSLVAKENCSFKKLVEDITRIVNGPVSVEAVATSSEELIKEAQTLSSIGSNVVVKIPMTAEGLKAVKALSPMGVKTNVTLVFSANQALLAAIAGATYVSVFVGRLDDIGHVGMDVIRDSVSIFDTYGFKSEIITASIRHPIHVIDAAKAGSHVATIPPKILEQMFKHNLTDIGIKKFLDDWKSVKC